MKAIILAGGRGTRLNSVVKNVPKVMALIREKPFLEYLLKWLKKNHIKDVILSVGYKKEVIKNYFSTDKIKVLIRLFDNNDINIYFSEEKKSMGTGGAVKKAMEEFMTIIDNKGFFVLNGDCFSDINLFEMFEEHIIHGPRICTMLAIGVQDTNRYGRLKLFDSKVQEMKEKGISGSGCINGGIYFFSPSIKDYLKKKCSLEHYTFPKLIKDERLYFYNENEYFIDIGTPEDYNKLCNEDFDKWKKMIES